MARLNLKPLKKIRHWGASVSAHQVEGKNHNQWTVWELEHAAELAAAAERKYADWLAAWPEVKDQAQDPANYVSADAVDHFNRFEADFDIAAKLNLNAFRFSIEWSRVEPEAGKWDDEAIGHYRAVLKALAERGLEPTVCLWHWTMPVWFAARGGFEKKENIGLFVRFCEKIGVELGEHFSRVIVLNEPNVYTGLSYKEGMWPPQIRSLWLAFRVYHNLIEAYARSYEVLKKVRPGFEIGIAQHATHFYAGDDAWLSDVNVRVRAWVWNWYFFERTKGRHDFTGINFYMSSRLFGFKTDNPDEMISDYGWNMEPANVEHVVMAAYQRYNRPVVITENGVADHQDRYRQWWLEETLGGIGRAVTRGAEVDGYFHWSLLDNFEWADGFWPRFGLVEVDRKTLKRTVRPSAAWLAQVLAKIKR